MVANDLQVNLLFLQGCTDLIEIFEEEERKKEEEMTEIKRRAEEEGIWEVQRILEVKFKKVKR